MGAPGPDPLLPGEADTVLEGGGGGLGGAGVTVALVPDPGPAPRILAVVQRDRGPGVDWKVAPRYASN